MGFIKDNDMLAVTSSIYDEKDGSLDAVPSGWDCIVST